MKQTILGIILFVAVVFLGGCGKGGDNVQVIKDKASGEISQKSDSNIDQNKTSLYLVKVDGDMAVNAGAMDSGTAESGGVGGQEALSPDVCTGELTKIKIDGKLSPQEALEKLFNYKNDTANGIYNTFAKSGNIKIDKLEIKNNFAIVHLTGDFKGNQICEGGIMHDQIVKTLSQFDNIAGADIFVGDNEISTYLSGMEGK